MADFSRANLKRTWLCRTLNVLAKYSSRSQLQSTLCQVFLGQCLPHQAQPVYIFALLHSVIRHSLIVGSKSVKYDKVFFVFPEFLPDDSAPLNHH